MHLQLSQRHPRGPPPSSSSPNHPRRVCSGNTSIFRLMFNSRPSRLDMALPQPLPCSRHPKLAPLGAAPQQASLLPPPPPHPLTFWTPPYWARWAGCPAAGWRWWTVPGAAESLAGAWQASWGSAPLGGIRGGLSTCHPHPERGSSSQGPPHALWSSACPWSPVLWEVRRGSGSQKLPWGLPKQQDCLES